MTETLSPNIDSFEHFNNYYDLLYNEKEYERETAYVSDILKDYNTHTRNILELGFGTGNYSKYLSKAGYNITGVERSEHMVALAKEKRLANFSPVAGDITTFNLSKKFDAAVSLFHVISYLTDNNKVIACLRHVHKHLKKNGIFVFDVWYTPAVYTQQPRTAIKRIETTDYEITRVAEPLVNYEQNVVQVNYQLIVKNKLTGQHQVLNETHSMRHFSTPEIKTMAELAGFTLVRSEEFFTAKQPGADTWGVCFILQKND